MEIFNDHVSLKQRQVVGRAQGEQAIGSLKPGEKVWAYNPQTKKMEVQPIAHVWINHDDDLVDLTLYTPASLAHGKQVAAASEVIHTNKKHPFLTQEEGFVSAGELVPGMHSVRADGNLGTVTGWKVVPGTKVMYNLEVAQDHTFTVGNGQWVVHNCGSTDSNAGNHWRESSLNNAPHQTTPGIRTLSGQHINDLGQAESHTAHYDQYGRMIGRTDYALGDATQNIEPTHYHVYSYNEYSGGFANGAMPFGDHIPGEFNPAEWASEWEFLL